MPKLKIVDPQQQNYEAWIPEDQMETTIGRSSKNAIPVSDVKLSRFHAVIAHKEHEYWVSDLGSSNGTYLNKQLLKAPALLKPGDIISAGETEIVFAADDVKDSASASKPSEPAVELLQDKENDPSTITTVLRTDEILRHLRAAGKTGITADKSISLLSILNQATNALITFRPLNELLGLIMKLVFDSIPAERGCLMLLEPKTGQLAPAVVWNRAKGGLSLEPITISKTIARQVVEEKTSVIITDTRLDERFSGQLSIIMQGVKSAMCVPLWDDNKVIGLIYVDSQNSVLGFTDDMLKILTSLANVAAIKIENTRLLESDIAKRKMEEELALAGEIQRSLLPSEPPDLEGYELAGYNAPTYQVGGDYYDYIQIEPRLLALTIADVSGKGTSASLLMASLRASLISLSEMQSSVADLISRLNRFICKSGGTNRFITFFYGQLDADRHLFRYCNAGHNPPLVLRRDGSQEMLSTGGLVLGIFDSATFSEDEVCLEPGDCLVLYTDGISETTNLSDEEYGVQRLVESVRANFDLPIPELQSRVIADVRAFQGDAAQADDMTLVFLRRNK
jgi:phosphoserine phosphatase RsbU/P